VILAVAGDYMEGVVTLLSLWPWYRVGSASSLAPWPLGVCFLVLSPSSALQGRSVVATTTSGRGKRLHGLC